MHLAVTHKDFSHSRHITYSSSVQFRFPLIPNTFSIYSKAIFSSIRDLKDWIGLMWAGLVHSSLPHLRACCICVNALSAIWLQPWLRSKNKEPEWTSENRREKWQSYYNFWQKAEDSELQNQSLFGCYVLVCQEKYKVVTQRLPQNLILLQ